MSSDLDPVVRRHLETVRSLYEETGALAYIRDVVGETWRVNRRRWSPDRYFDDTNTLGHQTSHNVNNRLYSTIQESDVTPSVRVFTESGIVHLLLEENRLRVVKAPIESGMTPNFDLDFDWSASSTREAAARRNSTNYYPLRSREPTLEFDGDPRPTHLRRIERCRDFFLIWAASLTSDGTAGWLGLPQSGDVRWMGVIRIWQDGPELGHDEDEDEDEDEG